MQAIEEPFTFQVPAFRRPGHRMENMNAELYFESGPRVIREAMRRTHGREW